MTSLFSTEDFSKVFASRLNSNCSSAVSTPLFLTCCSSHVTMATAAVSQWATAVAAATMSSFLKKCPYFTSKMHNSGSHFVGTRTHSQTHWYKRAHTHRYKPGVGKMKNVENKKKTLAIFFCLDNDHISWGPSHISEEKQSSSQGWLGHNIPDVHLPTFTPLVSSAFFPLQPLLLTITSWPKFLHLLTLTSSSLSPHTHLLTHTYLLILTSSHSFPPTHLLTRLTTSSPSSPLHLLLSEEKLLPLTQLLSCSQLLPLLHQCFSVILLLSFSCMRACEHVRVCVCIVMCWTVNWGTVASVWAGAQE